LTGIALPATPPYRVGGRLDYAGGVVKFADIAGKVGASDLAGALEVDTGPQRPVLTADLSSKLVDLKDLGGFIGAEPAGGANARRAAADGRVLPNDPISLPKLNAADVHLKYSAARIQGRAQPLDNMRAALDIENGQVHLHPLSFGIGTGQIIGDITLAAAGQQIHAKATIDFRRVDVGKLLNATGVAKGAGTIGGRAVIDGTGRSLAEILGFGNGELKLFMGPGGNVSALLVDLSGLQFGNALLSALGIPDRATLQCMAVDLTLEKGLATARTMVLDTDEARVGAKGWISLNREMLGLVLETDAKHFSVGSLPTPIDVGGTFANPSVAPQAGPLAARGAAAVALGIVGTPLAALLPTIQFGTGEDGACQRLLPQVRSAPRVPASSRNR
ncbi:MAG: AsmA family protein, partial [Janthinobacterium lividum]